MVSSEEKKKEVKKTFEEVKRIELAKFDKHLKSIKIPAILLERLKKEFDDSFSMSNVVGKPDQERTKP